MVASLQVASACIQQAKCLWSRVMTGVMHAYPAPLVTTQLIAQYIDDEFVDSLRSFCIHTPLVSTKPCACMPRSKQVDQTRVDLIAATGSVWGVQIPSVSCLIAIDATTMLLISCNPDDAVKHASDQVIHNLGPGVVIIFFRLVFSQGLDDQNSRILVFSGEWQSPIKRMVKSKCREASPFSRGLKGEPSTFFKNGKHNSTRFPKKEKLLFLPPK